MSVNIFNISFFKFSNLKSNIIFKNSFWGVTSNFLQNIFYSIFFIIIARQYKINDFSNYIIANTIYGFILTFSSLGLGQWFIRELVNNNEKNILINKFFKLQICIGISFYFISIVFSFLLYDEYIIRILTIIIGLNVVFDNIIYVIKHINIVEQNQKTTFILLTIDATLKFLFGCFLFYLPLPIIFFSVILVLLKFLTMFLFVFRGTRSIINIKKLYKTNVNYSIIKEIIYSNWPFIVIGTVSAVFWRIGNILISKFLTISDVATYEISFKLFSIAEIIPIIVSTTTLPILLKKFNVNFQKAIKFYKFLFFIYASYGIICYLFMYSFSDIVITTILGSKFSSVSSYSKEMFLTMLIFPTLILQANFFIVMKKERIDMHLNIITLFFNIILSIIGIYFYKSISAINYSLFISFLLFHFLQDLYFIYFKVLNFKEMLLNYLFLFLLAFIYVILSNHINTMIIFLIFIIIIFTFLYNHYKKFKMT